MVENSFRKRYKGVPAAISVQNDLRMTLPHNHEEMEILLIEKGRCDVRICEEVINCREGDVVFVNPTEMHSVTPCSEGEYLHKCICFDVSMINDSTVKEEIRTEKLCFEHHIGSNSGHIGVVGEYADRIFEEVLNEKTTSFMEISAYVSLIAAYMLKNNLTENREVKTGKFCSDVMKYVADNYRENITSKQVSDRLHFTQSYFCRRFKSEFGMSFSQYLNFYRVTQVVRISDSTCISDMAFECGFTDPVYFSKVFKKYMGVIPSKYKRSQ